MVSQIMPGSAKYELSIVMPCLNERETIGICVRKAKASLAKHQISGEVIVADNGSTDGSQEIGISEGARIVNISSRGYGAALMGGISVADSTYVLMGDADDSYDFSHVDRFLAPLRGGADLVMGNRFKGGIAPGAMPFLHRFLGNPVLSLLGRKLFNIAAGDFHCGLRAFNRDAILRLDLRTTGMEFASEMVVKASLYRYKIEEVPTTLKPDGRSRAPHLRTWRDGWRHLRFLLLYSPRSLFLYPGLFLMFSCGILAAVIAESPFKVGNIGLGVDTLAYCVIGFLIGYHSVAFYYGAKAFAVSEGLLPEFAFPARTLRYFHLEAGLAVSGVCILLGISGTLVAFSQWHHRGFGVMDPTSFLRLTLPSAALIAVGTETIFLCFFLSILFIQRRR
jgi:glycosyltransferase involved in cell wall biosynthesis